MMYSNWGWGAWLVMSLVMLAGIVVVLAALFMVFRSVDRPNDRSGAGPVSGPGHASRVLDERFARGEIDAAEYRQKRELLRS
jgi:putative membrane protein